MDAKVFCLSESRYLGGRVAEELGITLSEHEERDFSDGEYKLRPLETVQSCRVFIMESLFSEAQLSVHDKLWRLVLLAGACRDAGAEEVTLVAPYLCYARKDRRSKLLDPLSLRYVAELFESVGVERVMALEVHNIQAFENAFRCLNVNVDCATLFADEIIKDVDNDDIAVVSPDVGGIKRANLLRSLFENTYKHEVPLVVMEKYRSLGKISGSLLIGEMEGKTAIIYDDIIGAGETMVRCINSCIEHGAKDVYVAATHGGFTGEAWSHLLNTSVKLIMVSDSMKPFTRPPDDQRIRVVSSSRLIAETIKALAFA